MSLYVDDDYVVADYIQTGITIDWATRIIFVPKDETTLIQLTPSEIRELNIDTFRLILKALEYDTGGMTFPDTHIHNAPVSVGGVTLAEVVQIINGYTVTFEDGNYAVDLVGGNSNIADVLNLNRVSVRSSNSAGLVQTREIQHASFNEEVAVDVLFGTGGTLYDIGTLGNPVNNWADALLIASTQKLSKFLILNNTTLPSGDFSKFEFEGENAEVSLMVPSSANVTGCTFNKIKLSGTITNQCRANDCHLIDPITFAGYATRCYLQGVIKLIADEVHIVDCLQEDPSIPPTIDYNSTDAELTVSNYFGTLSLINKTGPTNSVVDVRGHLILNNTITNGTIKIGGSGYLEGSVGGTAVVDSATFLSNESIGLAMLDLVDAIESGLSPRQALRLITAAMAGKISGAPAGPVIIRNTADSKNRITATVDANGNRTSVTTDVT